MRIIVKTVFNSEDKESIKNCVNGCISKIIQSQEVTDSYGLSEKNDENLLQGSDVI